MTPSSPPHTVNARDTNVVFLVNFLAPNHIRVCQEIAARIGKLTVLCSVPMESNRDWHCDWGDLDVVVQKTWTLTRSAKHPSGYEDVNYIHIPRDTVGQLRRLNPDAVVSLELGARTGFSWLHRVLRRKCALVAAVLASERSEAGRGAARRFTRRRLLRRADWVTYNGPSCQRYLQSLGANPSFMSPWQYAADPDKPYRGQLQALVTADRLRLLTVGQLSDRKGVLPAAEQLANWCQANPSKQVIWNLLGTGPLESELRQFNSPGNLQLEFHGHCAADEIQTQYRDNDALLFPTLGDEWGLVVDEALHSGLPVIGSIHSQSAATLILDNINGWIYDPGVPTSLTNPLDQLAQQTQDQRFMMATQARQSVATRTPETSADQFVEAVTNAMKRRQKSTVRLANQANKGNSLKAGPT